MKKKEFLTEAKRKAIIADKEKAIIESFAKTFNKIKRIDENEIKENENINTLANILQNKGTLDHLKNNDRIRLKLIDGEFLKKNPEWKDKSLKFLFWDARSRMVGVELIGTGKSGNAYPKELVIDLEQTNIYEFEEENPLYSRQQEFGINPEKGENNLNSEINFDRIFDEIFSMEPEYDYDVTSSGYLSSGRDASDGNMTATFNNDELPISLTITYNNHWEEDEDGPGYWGYLLMSYDISADSGDAKLDDMLAKFGEKDLINYSKITGHGGTTVEQVKYYNMINTEFMNLLSDETKEKLYKQIESLIEKNDKYQRFD